MPKILVVDDEAICREPVAAVLEARGYTVVCAADGESALDAIRQNPPDLILLDIAMPGMDGLAVLDRLRRSPGGNHTPVILLTDQVERQYVVQAAHYGVRDYLLKSAFSVDTMLQRVQSCLSQRSAPPADTHKAITEGAATVHVRTAASEIRTPHQTSRGTDSAGETSSATRCLEELQPVITRAQLIKLVNEGLELRPLADVAAQAAALASNPRCSANELADVVMRDQGLSLRLLKLANSSAYSRGRPVESLREAVQRIGINEIGSLIMTLGIVQQYEGDAAQHVDPRMFWEHSIACGVIAASLAEALRAPQVESHFMWGLLHDVGRMIMLDQVPDAYANVFTAAHALDLPVERVERRLMTLDHCEVLERALEFWKFPSAFIIPVANHHRSMAHIQRLGPEHAKATMIVALADRLAHALLLGGSGNEVIYPIHDLIKALEIQAPVLRKIEVDVIKEVENLKLLLLSHGTGESWPCAIDVACKKLALPVSAMIICKDPERSSLRITFDRLSRGNRGNSSAVEPEAINGVQLGVIHCIRDEDLGPLLDQLAGEEKKAGCPELPVLIATPGNPEPSPLLAKRRHCFVPDSIRLDRLLATVNGLLAPE